MVYWASDRLRKVTPVGRFNYIQVSVELLGNQLSNIESKSFDLYFRLLNLTKSWGNKWYTNVEQVTTYERLSRTKVQLYSSFVLKSRLHGC